MEEARQTAERLGLPLPSPVLPHGHSPLPDGTRVTVQGLQGAAQHNGKSGEVYESNDVTGRYTVRLDDGEVLRIKPENLLQSCCVELTGIERKPELNGREGRIKEWDASSGRYHVSLDGQMVSLKPDNLILPPGARATVVGLVSQPRWNGSTCKVVSFDRERRRYTVQIDLEIGDRRTYSWRQKMYTTGYNSSTTRFMHKTKSRRARTALCASAKRRQMITPRPSRLMAPPRLSSPARAGPPRASPRPPRVSPPPPAPRPPPPAPRPPPQCTRRRPCRGR